MTVSLQGLDLASLSASERIQLAQDLLDSVLAETRGEFFSPDQLEEIDRRVAAADAGQLIGEPWEAVYERLQQK